MASEKNKTLTVEEQNEIECNLRYQAVLVAQSLTPKTVQDLLKSASKVFDYLKTGSQ